jgi:glycosyltransferase involved in cell wall biosynthesis
MKIAMEIGWSNKAGGARRVAFNILREMCRIAPQHDYQLLANRHHDQVSEQVTQHPLPPPEGLPEVLYDQFLFPHLAVPRKLKEIRPDVAFFTNNLMPFWGIGSSVVIIHDMTPFIIPDSFLAPHGLYQRRYFRHAARRADHILTVSENSKQDICRLLEVKPERVTVMPLAAELPSITDQAVDLSITDGRPYLLYVGAIHPRKNVKRLVQAFSKLQEAGYPDHLLVIVGQQRWMSKEILNSDAYLSASDRIIFAGRITDTELAALYSGCDAFVYPSIYEGFGLPVLEAMAYGAPVLTSNISSLPEVAGDAALLVDPYETDDILEGICKLIDSPDLALSYQKKGLSRSKEFSWEKTARRALDVLESVS